MNSTSTLPRVIKKSVSLPRTQIEWIEGESERQEHGNFSRIVQEAIKQYRDEVEFRRERAVRELERIA